MLVAGGLSASELSAPVPLRASRGVSTFSPLAAGLHEALLLFREPGCCVSDLTAQGDLLLWGREGGAPGRRWLSSGPAAGARARPARAGQAPRTTPARHLPAVRRTPEAVGPFSPTGFSLPCPEGLWRCDAHRSLFPEREVVHVRAARVEIIDTRSSSSHIRPGSRRAR